MQGLLLHEFAGWHFWRFDVDAQLGDGARWLQYSLHMDGVDVNYRCVICALCVTHIQSRCSQTALNTGIASPHVWLRATGSSPPFKLGMWPPVQVPGRAAIQGPGLELGLPFVQRAVCQRGCQEVEGPPLMGGCVAGKRYFLAGISPLQFPRRSRLQHILLQSGTAC